MAMNEPKSKISVPKEGIVPARLAYVIEVGEHMTDYGVKDQVYFHYCLPTRIIEDEGELQGKQHMVRSAPMNNSSSERASLFEHRRVLAPQGNTTHEELLDRAAYLTIQNQDVMKNGVKRTYTNIVNISGVPEGQEVGALDVTPFYFDFDNPDPDIWENRLWDQVREKIMSALNYQGSKVEQMVNHLEAMSEEDG